MMIKGLRRRAGLAALVVPALAMLSGVAGAAGLTFSFEAPGVQATTRSGVITETFDPPLMPGEYLVINSAIGTYTAQPPDGALVVTQNLFGGANQSNYLTVNGNAGGSQEVELSFGQGQTYFGFWFAAIDSNNSVTFFDGLTPLLTLNETNIYQALGGNLVHYQGNPNLSPPNDNPNEAYVYINIDADLGVTFDRIVFKNLGGSGLESDNHSILQPTAVPEPTSLAMAGVGGLVLAGIGVRRRRVASRG